MCKIWALVTGEIRTELYLRLILAKLSQFRSEHLLDGIVLSTWIGSIDRFEGLRQQLEFASVVTVETDYEGIESEAFAINKFDVSANAPNAGNIGFIRQQVTIQKGLEAIPDDAFVLKLRTDFIQGIDSFFDRLSKGCFRTDIKRCGNFPVLQNYRITLLNYRAENGFVTDDRFFFGYKEDLLKIVVPMDYNRFANFQDSFNANLVHGYAEWQYPLLRKMRNILPFSFWDRLNSFYPTIDDDELDLPIVLYRIYATNLLWLNTGVSFAVSKKSHDDSVIPLKGFFDCFMNYNEDDDIEKWYAGHVYKTKASEKFYQELEKVKKYDVNARSYSYAEYEELKEFAKNKLCNENLVKDYTIKEYKYDNNLDEDRQFSSWFIIPGKTSSKDGQLITKLSNLVKEKSFDCVGDSLFSIVNEPVDSLDTEYGKEFVKAAIFDHNHRAMFIYLKGIYEGCYEFNYDLYRTTLRNLWMDLLYTVGNASSHLFLAYYYLIQIYRKFNQSLADVCEVSEFWIKKMANEVPIIKEWFGSNCVVENCDENLFLNSWELYLRKKVKSYIVGRKEAALALGINYLSDKYDLKVNCYGMDQISISKLNKKYIDIFSIIPSKSRIVLWGGGNIGCLLYTVNTLTQVGNICYWVDKRWYKLDSFLNPPSIIQKVEFDYIIIASEKKDVVNEIEVELKSYDIETDKILKFD